MLNTNKIKSIVEILQNPVITLDGDDNVLYRSWNTEIVEKDTYESDDVIVSFNNVDYTAYELSNCKIDGQLLIFDKAPNREVLTVRAFYAEKVDFDHLQE